MCGHDPKLGIDFKNRMKGTIITGDSFKTTKLRHVEQAEKV